MLINTIDYVFLIIYPLQMDKDSANTKLKRGQWLLLIVPDFLFQFPYLILFWVMVKTSVEGHINLASDFYIPTITKKTLGNLILFCFILIYFISQATLMAIYQTTDLYEFYTLQLEISIFIICITTIVLLYNFYMWFHSSGKPYKSEFYEKRLKQLTIVIVTWSILKLIRGILGCCGSRFILKITDLHEDSGWQFYLSISYSLIFVICDAIPVILSLNGSLVSIFHQSHHDVDEEQIPLIEEEAKIEDSKTGLVDRDSQADEERKSSHSSKSFKMEADDSRGDTLY